jgi:hypothetical protein
MKTIKLSLFGVLAIAAFSTTTAISAYEYMPERKPCPCNKQQAQENGQNVWRDVNKTMEYPMNPYEQGGR